MRVMLRKYNIIGSYTGIRQLFAQSSNSVSCQIYPLEKINDKIYLFPEWEEYRSTRHVIGINK